MYKLVRPDGFDFYSCTINYADNLGKIIRATDFDPPEIGACGKGLHASRNPNDCFVGAKIPCRAFRVKGIQRIAGDSVKSRYKALKIVEEIMDLDKLFGWRYAEVVNPVNPLSMQSPQITQAHINSLEAWASAWTSVKASMGASMWASVMDSVWVSVWASVRASVRDSAWASVKDSVWVSVWASVRDSVWASVRDSAWASVKDSMGDSVMASVWASVWAYIGYMFPGVTKWKGIKHPSNIYPFQASVDLWKNGLVPSFDGKVWRLHGGMNSKILYEQAI